LPVKLTHSDANLSETLEAGVATVVGRSLGRQKIVTRPVCSH